ncbi:T9SS type A sorting domain-containing protein [Hymenobacter negativus]|uniref:T9SS type A sorting domain-containing protein n=1 Tax=Hymenobacter negativus TaxID=2795026 RepID=A0ABS0Q9M4_9BACT|nr:MULTISPECIES: T9SS type A sorting domain-containing protein [Bacteria]MBH8559381.1 T9SS type A sorting domain-containing protein [Hymenobacter negativus]MBH8568313.1 T9SS type A sorting domain-containing protein [Hymenobacter negativus]MBR7208048.1 T9SS type A sorting domain-containing protein [Microvirga sp. STS02]
MPTQIIGTGTAAAAASITGFTLVNADTDTDLFAMTPGMVIDLATLPTRNVNIRADTDLPLPGSVVMNLTGAQTRNETQDFAPYALFSDYQGDYFPWSPPVGSYSLLATPFDDPGGTGNSGAPLTLSFTVVNSVGGITSFTLVNADTDTDIQTMTSGMTLTLASLPTSNLNIRANTNPATVGSVTFDLTGPQTHSGIENQAPYALYSDLNGDYAAWTPVSGTYTLTAMTFDAAQGGGTQGSGLTISFVVVAPALPVRLTAFLAEPLQAGAVQLRWNTATEEQNKEFVVQRSVDGREFISVAHLPGHGNTILPQTYQYIDKQLPSNLSKLYYRLQQVDVDGTSTYSPVRVVTVVPGAAPAPLQAYVPTPADGLLHYTFLGPATGTEELVLYSIMGQRLGRYRLAASGSGTLPVTGLAAGTYVLHLTNAGGSYAGRFVLP